jgi:hypothetical protein
MKYPWFREEDNVERNGKYTAYAVGDVEDFFGAGKIPLDRLLKNRNTRRQFTNSVFARTARKNVPLPGAQDELRQAFDRVIGYFPSPSPIRRRVGIVHCCAATRPS